MCQNKIFYLKAFFDQYILKFDDRQQDVKTDVSMAKTVKVKYATIKKGKQYNRNNFIFL